jgi:thiopurine S-methyltransferase
MDAEFWLQRWQKNEIGFHSPTLQPALLEHWRDLDAAKGARVLVPLCGKSLDMVWLANQGFKVVGAELSEVAVEAFFAENKLNPQIKTVDSFSVRNARAFELWCGDFFALKRADVNCTAAYDRAALVAMPPEMQPRYAAKMAELMPADGQVLLVGLDYNQQEMQGPPFSIPQARVRELFEKWFDVTVLDARNGLTKSEHLAKRGITRLEEATYHLRRRA